MILKIEYSKTTNRCLSKPKSQHLISEVSILQ